MRKPKHSDHGTPERARRGGLVLEETVIFGRLRARDPTPDALDFYHARKLLGEGRDNQRRYDAGARLRGAWDRAGLEPQVIGRYSDLIASGSVQGHQVANIQAYRDYQRAMIAVGPIASNEVAEVCCWGRAVGDYMEILRRGLEQLAKHYGY